MKAAAAAAVEFSTDRKDQQPAGNKAGSASSGSTQHGQRTLGGGRKTVTGVPSKRQRRAYKAAGPSRRRVERRAQARGSRARQRSALRRRAGPGRSRSAVALASPAPYVGVRCGPRRWQASHKTSRTHL